MERASSPTGVLYRRFDACDRVLHGVLMFGFLGLAFTGLPLLFSEAGWAGVLVAVFGGPHGAGVAHRVFAGTVMGCFAAHVLRLMHRLFVRRDREILWGPSSMTPRSADVVEMAAHLRYFLRLGPRPGFDHFTYWEKFNYWVVFWGMGIIAGSGLVLWFPEFFARWMPGTWFNVALLVHGEEGLLAVGFVFTVHFFHGHLRPEKLPMDPVIFTGRVGADQLREERPVEFARLGATGRLEEAEIGPPAPWLSTLAKGLAVIVLPLGLGMVGLILYALVW